MSGELSYYGVLEELEKYLLYQRESGVQRLDVEHAVLLDLAREPDPEEAPKVVPEAIPTFDSLETLAQHVAGCRNCELCQNRTLTVPGEGNISKPEIMFVGEGPGADEDRQGRPFVGAAGQLLTKMIEAMGYARSEVYIANVVKCRPPENRQPKPEEMAACLPYLQQQIRLLQPKVLVALGGTAAKGLLQRKVAITRIRGSWLEYEGIPLMPTYHPSYLLREPRRKKEAWEDLKMVLARLERTPPSR